uniref:Uncharacterized protein n=1 Tax=Anopheles farauti TaxID=69004 RepID=A0A182Q4A8_9DIPT
MWKAITVPSIGIDLPPTATYLRRLGAGRTVLPGSVSIGVMLNSGLLNWIFFDGIFTLLLLLPLPPPPPPPMPPTLMMLANPLPFGSVALGGPLPPVGPPLLLTLLIDISSMSLLENFFSNTSGKGSDRKHMCNMSPAGGGD